DEIYGAVEVGGVIRSLDGGEHWDNMSHGQYVNDDTVDMHGVLVGRWRPGQVFAIGRAGLFCSADRGEHWASARLEPLNPNGQTYCRDIRETPGDSKTIWVAAGATFQSEVGVLFRSKDGGASWSRVDMGVKPKTTMFTLAFDTRQPRRMFCATSGGEVFASEDGGRSWGARPLPEGARSRHATPRSRSRAGCDFASASISATSSSRASASTETASTSPPVWKASPTAAASVCRAPPTTRSRESFRSATNSRASTPSRT